MEDREEEAMHRRMDALFTQIIQLAECAHPYEACSACIGAAAQIMVWMEPDERRRMADLFAAVIARALAAPPPRYDDDDQPKRTTH